MKDPPRLLDEGATDVERDLLRAALAERPSERWMRDARGVLGATGLAASSTVASAGVGAKVGAAASLKWFGIWFSIAALSGSVTLVARQRMRAAPVIVPVVENRMPAAAAEPAQPASAEPDPALESMTPAPVRADRPAAKPNTLSAEVASLDNVKQFLVGGDPAAALNALAKYHTSFPAPMLGPEATVLEVQALMAQGDAAHRARAIALARRFVRMHPTSPHASQLEALLSKAHEP